MTCAKVCELQKLSTHNLYHLFWGFTHNLYHLPRIISTTFLMQVADLIESKLLLLLPISLNRYYALAFCGKTHHKISSLGSPNMTRKHQFEQFKASKMTKNSKFMMQNTSNQPIFCTKQAKKTLLSWNIQHTNRFFE